MIAKTYDSSSITADVNIFSEKEIENIARKFFDGTGDTVDEHLWIKNYKQLSDAIGKGYTTITDEQDIRMNYELRNNVAVFAAFKSWRMGGDVRNILVDESGNKRQWGDFLKEYKRINGDYNINWLSAEFNLAQRQASAARQWQDFIRDKSVYPNLEYMPSKSASPSDQHKVFYGMIKPIDDPVWNNIMPPSRWNCQCWVRQSREEPTSKKIDVLPPPAGIVGNSGKTGMIFSPQHPYIKDAGKQDKKAVKEAFTQLRNALNDEYIDFKAKKGKVRISMNAHSEDYIENFNYAKTVTDKNPGVFKILAHSNKKGIKNPEYNYKGVTGDRTLWDGNNIKNYVSRAFRKIGTNKQLGGLNKVFLAFDFAGKLNSGNYIDAVNQLMPKLSKTEFVTWKNGSKVIVIKSNINKSDLISSIKKELL